MKRIFWPLGNVNEALYDLRICEALKRKMEVEFYFVTALDLTAKKLNELGVPHKTSAQLMIEAAENMPTKDDDLIDKANAILGGIDVNLIVHGDHMLSLTMSRPFAQILASKTVLAYDWLFKHEKFDAMIRYGGNALNSWITSIMAEKHDIPVLVLVYAAVFNRCGVQTAGIREQWDWLSFDREWEKWKGKNVPAEAKQKIDATIGEYVQSHSKAKRSKLADEIDKTKKLSHRWKSFRRRVKEYFSPLPLTVPDEEAYIQSPNVNYLETLFENQMQMGRRRWLRNCRTFAYDEVPDKYIYMPLNQPDDAPHVAWNPMNYLQEFAAIIVHESLPAGYQLVIKEHPYSCGFPSHETLRKLQRLGVKIAHPTVHSLELIKNAAAVFCPGDTTGWEAILLQRPVVNYCAKPFYHKFPLVYNVSDPNQVHHALRKAVQSGPLTTEQQELRYAFIHSVYESSYPGDPWGYKGLLWSPVDHSDQNVENLAEMFVAELQIAWQENAPSPFAVAATAGK